VPHQLLRDSDVVAFALNGGPESVPQLVRDEVR
jgi:hypothetical protein